MKTILLLIHDDEGQEARLQAALDVTRALGGHLTCLEVELPPAAMTWSAWDAFTAAGMIDIEEKRLDRNRGQVEARLAREDVPWDWVRQFGFPERVVESEAGLCDLVVLSTRLGRDELAEIRDLAGDVARRGHRAVLAVPPGATGIDLFGTVVVAWDGSREADEALREAVPLLKLAREVILLDLDEPEGALATTAAASYLARNAIAVRSVAVERTGGERVYGAILDHARAAKAGYIVMGAFGMASPLEATFGGVTRSMLAHSEFPLLLAHP